MKGRTPTTDEKRHMDRVASLGCIVCRLHYGIETPAGIHHTDGRTKPGCHYKVLPLCGRHHQESSPTGDWATRHAPGRNAGKHCFEAAYGTEDYLLQKVDELL